MIDKKTYLLLTILFTGFCSLAQVSCDNETTYEGEGTYYFIDEFGDFGNCSIENENFSPFLTGAMNKTQYAKADYCGACVLIEGPQGSVKVHIIDQCPECASGDIDLSPEAFDYLAPRIDGRIPISWKLVPCDVTGNIQFYFKTGSSQYWTAIQVRNHKNKLETVEYWDGVQYVTLPRFDFNYFIAEQGMGIGPYKLRITDVYGNEIIENNIPLVLTTSLEGQYQFPDCEIVGLEDRIELTYFNINNQKLSFEDQGIDYQLFDSQGRIIAKSNSSKKSELDLEIGVYVLKMNHSDKIYTQKIIIQ